MTNPTVDEILRAIPGRCLVQLAESDKDLSTVVEQAKEKKSEKKRSEKKKVELSANDARKIIQKEIRRISGKILAETMSTKQRADAVAKLNINHEEQGNNPKSSRVHKKRLLEAVEGGVLDFLKEHVDAEALVEIGEAFYLELSADEKVEKLAGELTNQIEFEAAVAFLESFPNDILLDVAFEMKLCEPTTTASTSVVVEAITTQTEIKELKKPAPTKKKIKVSKTKPKIAKGVTYDDLFQWYTVEELREFAKDNEVLVSGSKKELIKRLLAWFDGDKENTTKEGLKEKAAAKAAKKKKTTKKSSKKSGDEGEEEEEPKTKSKTETKAKTEKAKAEPTKKETKDTKKDTKEAKKEAKAEPEPEEDIDLERLNDYSVEVLKKYCADEGIEVSGKQKKHYVEAILKYNEEDDDDDTSQ